MNTELQNKVWSILPKEFKEEVKYEYYKTKTKKIKKEYDLGFLNAHEGMFGTHNLTSDVEGEEDELLTYYCQWAKLRVISELEIPDSESQYNVYRYKVQTRKRFLWWKWWHTELSCNSRKIAKDAYYELMDQIREKKK